MSKIYFVPDVHLQEQSPRSRKDSYPTTVLEKMQSVVDIVNKNNGMCIFLGDVFNAVNMPTNYLYRCVDVFKNFNKKPYIIYGNHDIPRNNQDLMDRSPLGLLVNTGLVEELRHLELEGRVVIDGFHYTEAIAQAKQFTSTAIPMKKICVAHVFFEDGFAETHNLHVEDCAKLSYDYYVLGHDHTPYEDFVANGFTVYRPGSLTRGTANDKQLTRDRVYILEYDTILDKFTKIPIPCLPAKDVFKESVFIRKSDDINMEKVLDNLVFTSNDSIYDVLDRSEQPKEIKDIVEQYLQGAGIFRDSIK